MQNHSLSRTKTVAGFYRLISATLAISLLTANVSMAAQTVRKLKHPQATKAIAKVASVSKRSMAPTARRAPASAGIADSQRALEIRGQSRNLSMLLVLKNRNESIDFVKPRDSYHEEIQRTGF